MNKVGHRTFDFLRETSLYYISLSFIIMIYLLYVPPFPSICHNNRWDLFEEIPFVSLSLFLINVKMHEV